MGKYFLLLCMFLPGCAAKDTQEDSSNHPDFQLSATSSSVAVGNFLGRIQYLESRHENSSLQKHEASELVELWTRKTQFLGSVFLFEKIDLLTHDFTERYPDDEMVWQMRANALAHVHEFSTALVVAGDHGVEDKSLALSIEQARGHGLHDILSVRESEFARHSSPSNAILLADVLGRLGDVDRADKILSEARTKYRDVSPFALADLFFRQGMLWGEVADPPQLSRARHYYEAAIFYLPEFVRAQLHLAEVLHKQGLTEKSISHVEKTLSADDPEGRGIYFELVGSPDADHHLDDAKKIYARLLANFELAFSDHAAAFYLGPGDDTELAKKLALTNFSNRKTKASVDLAIQALIANGQRQQACDLWQNLPNRLQIETICD